MCVLAVQAQVNDYEIGGGNDVVDLGAGAGQIMIEDRHRLPKSVPPLRPGGMLHEVGCYEIEGGVVTPLDLVKECGHHPRSIHAIITARTRAACDDADGR
jgi:hypothetical protein